MGGKEKTEHRIIISISNVTTLNNLLVLQNNNDSITHICLTIKTIITSEAGIECDFIRYLWRSRDFYLSLNLSFF